MGKALMMVTAIGDDTRMGRMATMVAEASAGQASFTQMTNRISLALMASVLAILCVIWVAGFFRSKDFTSIIKQSLPIIIIGVPVGLPTVVTTTMAVGAAFLGRKQAIVQRITAIETFAGVEVLCSDKYASVAIYMLQR